MRILLAASFLVMLASQNAFEEQNLVNTSPRNRSLIIVEEQELRNISSWTTLFMIVIRFMGPIAFEPKHNPTAALRCEIFARLLFFFLSSYPSYSILTHSKSDTMLPESLCQH